MTILEVQQHLEGISAEIESLPAVPEDAMTYSELKMQLMVNYVANLSFYVSLKHRGVKVSDHPVFAHLAYLRTFMERLAPLDASLKYLIEKLLIAEETLEEASTAAGSAAGPNLAAFVKNHITVDQVRKQQTSMEWGSSSNHRMEIDPAMIAAQIQKAQQQGGNKRRKPVKTYVEEDSEREEESEPEPEPKQSRKSHKQSKKTKVSSDDEEIDSDFEL